MLKKKYTSENHVDGAGVHERGGGGDLSSRMLWMKSSEPRLEVRWMYKHLLTAKCLLSVAEGGRMPVMIREKRRWSGRWCRVIWLMSVISYRIASEITGCGLEEERETEKCEKKANAEGEKWIHVWPARKIYPFMPKKNELSLHGQNEKKKRKKNRGENAEEKENCSLFRVGEKCIYNKKKIYILKCSKKKM